MQSSDKIDWFWHWNENIIDSAERVQWLSAINWFYFLLFQIKSFFFSLSYIKIFVIKNFVIMEWNTVIEKEVSDDFYHCAGFIVISSGQQAAGIWLTLWWKKTPKSVQEFLTVLFFFFAWKKWWKEHVDACGTLLNSSNAVSKVMYSIALFFEKKEGKWCNLMQQKF